MAEFNLADVLRDVSAQDLGQPGREQIEYIDIDLIDPDPKNFYDLCDLDELAANIELVGLQQPLRVRDNPDAPDHVILVSGHRRRAAIQMLVADGNDQFRAVACIRESTAASDALQELRLIYANSGTRKMSLREISEQAKRVEMLLYQLKEQGVEFPGRMRDHVAVACKVSKSKLARLKVIRENLIPELQAFNNRDELSESVAYALAQMDPEDQKDVFNALYADNEHPRSVSEYRIQDYAKFSKKFKDRRCKINKGSCCTNRDAMVKKWLKEHSWIDHNCERVKCCGDCPELGSCKSACPMLGEKIKQIKADKREAKRQEKAAQEAKEYPDKVMIRNLWIRFGFARKQAGLTVKQACDASERYYYPDLKKIFEEHENDNVEVTIHEDLPFKFLNLAEIKSLLSLADALGCSLDYLFCRTDERTAVSAWHDPSNGDLPEKGETVIALVQYVPGAVWKPELLDYTDEGWKRYGIKIPEDIAIRWQLYNDPDKIVPDLDTDEEE